MRLGLSSPVVLSVLLGALDFLIGSPVLPKVQLLSVHQVFVRGICDCSAEVWALQQLEKVQCMRIASGKESK